MTMTRGHHREFRRPIDGPSRTALRGLLTLVFTAGWILLAGCDEEVPGVARPLDVRLAFGEAGHADGQIVYPRGIDHATDGTLWMIDKSARVHHFSRAGDYLGGWIMPASSRGKPTGITCGPDGLVYLADTHEYCISVFEPAGRSGHLIDQWGTYGDGPGEFRYVTDVAIVTDDRGEIKRFYVSEYGGNDRISAFDAEHDFLFSFGTFGASIDEPNEIVFSRPQSVLYDEALDQIIVSDSGNHRVGRFTLEGELLGWVGSDDGIASHEPGHFGYPYGLASVGDGTILVSEFGTNRVQHIDPVTGESLGLYGVGGRGRGELAFPWGVTIVKRHVFVLDSANHRIQSFTLGGDALLW